MALHKHNSHGQTGEVAGGQAMIQEKASANWSERIKTNILESRVIQRIKDVRPRT